MIRITEDLGVSNNAILQHLHNKFDKDLYRAFNDGSTVFSTFINGNFLAENKHTKEVLPHHVQMYIVYDYQCDTKQLEVYISKIVISQDNKASVFKDEAEIKDLETYLRDKLLGLYTCSLF